MLACRASTMVEPLRWRGVPRSDGHRSREGGRPREWIILIVLVVLLLAAIGPRAGYYGTASPLWDIISLIVFIAVVVWLLDLLGVINVFG